MEDERQDRLDAINKVLECTKRQEHHMETARDALKEYLAASKELKARIAAFNEKYSDKPLKIPVENKSPKLRLV